jgi:hypothetical protein
MQENRQWLLTLILATLAVSFAAIGLAGTTLIPVQAPAFTGALLLASLGCTAGAFGVLASRLRRLELENEGLIEELSQEFDRVKTKIEIFEEAFQEPRTLAPETVEAQEDAVRRVVVK